MWPFKSRENSENQEKTFSDFLQKNNINIAKENKLKEALRVAITALEQDTVVYNWKKQSSCNCGIMVQAITGLRKKDVEFLFSKAVDESSLETDKNTWRDVVQHSCSITGQPLSEVFKFLTNKGLTVQDIVHLEYLNNAAILELTDIDTDEESYFTNQENLIKYLKAWLSILDGTAIINNLTSKSQIEAELLIAVNEEDYETASKLQNKLTSL